MVVDMQEKLVPAIAGGEQIVKEVVRLLKTADALNVPREATVQYPKGLGNLVDPLGQWFQRPEAKMDFSAAVCRRSLDTWARQGRDQIVVVGIETHICVLQTVLDLTAEGFAVFVAADAVAARKTLDHDLAIERMRSAGATILTAESVMFELLGTADHLRFKEISKLVKDGA
jgi:nicotinamidase-related amidase